MPRSATATKDRILTAAYGLLYKEGFARVSMDAIAAAASVTKRTIYYHFDSKDALVAAVLDHQHIHALSRFQGWANPAAKSAVAFLQSLFDQLQLWVSKPKWHGSGFTRLTMELADLPGHPARHAAHHHKSAAESWLKGELAKRGARRPHELARQVMILIEGCLSMALIHDDTSSVGSAAQAAARLADAETN